MGKVFWELLWVVILVVAVTTAPWVVCFTLIDAFNRISVLGTVWLAVARPYKLLLATLLLFLIFIYLFTVIAWAFFPMDVFEENDDKDAFYMCDGLWSCFMFCLKYGLQGGLGDYMSNGLDGDLAGENEYPEGHGQWLVDFVTWDPANRTEANFNTGVGHFYGRWLFDVLFFLLVNTILMQIVFGIIVDTFAQLRDDNNAIQDDKENVCFICGLTSSTLNFKGNGFVHHIKKEHHMWNYFFYFVYLRKKPLTHHTRTDAWVYRCAEKADLSCFPLFAAMSVEDDEDADAQYRRTMLEQQAALDLKLVALNNAQWSVRETLRRLERDVQKDDQQHSELKDMVTKLAEAVNKMQLSVK